MFSKKKNTVTADIRTTSRTIETIIGDGVVFEGTIHGEATIRVDGTVKGNTDIKGCLIIGETGKVTGDVITDRILIAGNMTGNIDATERVELVAGGNLVGDIVTKSLIVADGAMFDGNCRMTKPAAPKAVEETTFGGSDEFSLSGFGAPDRADAPEETAEQPSVF